MDIFSAFNLGILLVLVFLPRWIFKYHGELTNKIPLCIRATFCFVVGGLWMIQVLRSFQVVLPAPEFLKGYLQTYFSILPPELQFGLQMSLVFTTVLALQLFVSSYIRNCCMDKSTHEKFLSNVGQFRWIFILILAASVLVLYDSMTDISNTFLNTAHLMAIGMAVNIVLLEGLAYYVQWQNVEKPNIVYHKPIKPFIVLTSTFGLLIFMHLPHEPKKLKDAGTYVARAKYEKAIDAYKSFLNTLEVSDSDLLALHPAFFKANLGQAQALERQIGIELARTLREKEGMPIKNKSRETTKFAADLYKRLDETMDIYQQLKEHDKWCAQAFEGSEYIRSLMTEYPRELVRGRGGQ